KSDIVIDLARLQGAKDGAVVELWRPYKVKHPVTGADITDQFLIGRLKLTQVRDTLAFARPQGALAREPHPGDVVILRTAPVVETKHSAQPAPVPGVPAAPAPVQVPTGT